MSDVPVSSYPYCACGALVVVRRPDGTLGYEGASTECYVPGCRVNECYHCWRRYPRETSMVRHYAVVHPSKPLPASVLALRPVCESCGAETGRHSVAFDDGCFGLACVECFDRWPLREVERRHRGRRHPEWPVCQRCGILA